MRLMPEGGEWYAAQYEGRGAHNSWISVYIEYDMPF
jgi:hypothetical protein